MPVDPGRRRASPTALAAIQRHIGAGIRRQRRTVGLSQIELAKAVGINVQQLQRYEQGESRIYASTLYAIASLLGVSAAVFYDGLEANPKF